MYRRDFLTAFFVMGVFLVCTAGSVPAGDIVPGLNDGEAVIDLTAAQVGAVGDISPIGPGGNGEITLAARFTPAPADLDAAGPVIIIESGGTTYGNGLYLAGGDLIFATKGSNGIGGNNATQTGLNDTDVSDSAAAVTIGPVSAGAETEAYVSYDANTGDLLASINGNITKFTISGALGSANLSGDESVSFLGFGGIIVGQLGGLTNTSQGQGPLWDANQAVNFTGMVGDVRGQIFAGLAPGILPPNTIVVQESGNETVISENGENDEISISLSSDPAGYPVTIALNAAEPAQIGLSSNQLVFTHQNWQTPQSVTIAAVDDNLKESLVHITLLELTVQTDPASVYAGQVVNDIPVHIQENDCETWGYSQADVNFDCQIDLLDMVVFIEQWLECSMPVAGCGDFRP